jgi:hypothetical protein
MMTQEEMESLSHIPTDTVRADLQETEREIKDKEDERAVLIRNPIENKVRIYMLEGGISSRKVFVEKLTALLKYRESKLPNNDSTTNVP